MYNIIYTLLCIQYHKYMCMHIYIYILRFGKLNRRRRAGGGGGGGSKGTVAAAPQGPSQLVFFLAAHARVAYGCRRSASPTPDKKSRSAPPKATPWGSTGGLGPEASRASPWKCAAPGAGRASACPQPHFFIRCLIGAFVVADMALMSDHSYKIILCFSVFTPPASDPW